MFAVFAASPQEQRAAIGQLVVTSLQVVRSR